MARDKRIEGPKIRERLATGDTYVALLALLFFDYFAIALLPDARGPKLLLTALVGATLVLALHTSHARGRLVKGAAVALALSVAISSTELALNRPLFTGSSTLILGVLLFVTPFVILRRILRHPRVDIETVVGAIDVYLLIGLVFWAVYSTIAAHSPNEFFNQVHHPSPNQMLYFSFVTLTTLGYGDLTPATDLGRALVVFEAIIGQIFLVTLVARLVALFGTGRADTENPPDLGAAAEAD